MRKLLTFWIFHEFIAELGFGSQFCCLFQDDWNQVKRRKPGTCEFRETSVCESRWVMIFVNEISEVRGSQVKDAVSKSPGLKCEVVAGL
jgi:hypothetical protein